MSHPDQRDDFASGGVDALIADMATVNMIIEARYENPSCALSGYSCASFAVTRAVIAAHHRRDAINRRPIAWILSFRRQHNGSVCRTGMTRDGVPPCGPGAVYSSPRVRAGRRHVVQSRRRLWLQLALLLSMAPVAANEPGVSSSETQDCGEGRVTVRLDNDLFGGRQQDQGYTGGAAVTLAAPRSASCSRDRVSRGAYWLSNRLAFLHVPGEVPAGHFTSISHALYTPEDARSRQIIRADRPYAGVLVASFGMTTQFGRQQVATQLQLGLVGPGTLGEQSQNLAHRLFGNTRFAGWHHQLRSEPLINAVYDRSVRTTVHAVATSSWQWDAIGHGAAAVGNGSTYVAAGGEFRLGAGLPYDFGSSPQRTQGDQVDGESRSDWAGHVFLTAEARWVGRDITLDGNTFLSSHRVDRRTAVGELGYGMSVRRGRIRVVLARYLRSREFDTQRESPAYGSLSVSYDLKP